jgi:dienelactone hydrolase
VNTQEEKPKDGKLLPDGLPDPLRLSGGGKVTSPQVWKEKRRPELLELFRTHVYGRMPVKRPPNQGFVVESVTPKMMGGKATGKKVAINYEGPGGKGTLRFGLFIPEGAPRPVPAFILVCNRGEDNIDMTREKKSPFWPAEEIVARGYAAVAFHVAQTDPDKNDGFKDGVHGLFDRGRRAPDAWGTIAAWAWGASRVLDYLETDPAIDKKRVAVVGHSRGGKTALWAGAEDERFALTISNDSGCTGAAITRNKKGERIADINKTFPHWFCENCHRYDGRENDLPVDQHELIALIAPRPVYVASASEDEWAYPPAEFAACVAASPVYELLGRRGVGTDKMPVPDAPPLHTGSIGYHLRPGKHDLTIYDWQRYMDFADRHMK